MDTGTGVVIGAILIAIVIMFLSFNTNPQYRRRPEEPRIIYVKPDTTTTTNTTASQPADTTTNTDATNQIKYIPTNQYYVPSYPAYPAPGYPPYSQYPQYPIPQTAYPTYSTYYGRPRLYQRYW